MPSTTSSGHTPLRVLLAVGDRERERRLSRELGVVIAGRCLDAASLAGQATADVDVVLVSADLHRLTAGTLLPLQEHAVPVVLLVTEATDPETYAALARFVPAEASSATISAALLEAADRGASYEATGGSAAAPISPGSSNEAGQPASGTLVGVTSGKGAPGKTTLAIALAASLAADRRDVALVDADLRGGNVAPCLDLDPRRGLVGLRADDVMRADGPAVLQELQDARGLAVLAGVERPELADALDPTALVEAVAMLRERFPFVVVDLGSHDSRPESAVQEALLRVSTKVLLVTGADLVSLWNTQISLRAMRAGISSAVSQMAVVVNRREGREHYDCSQVEHALELPVLGDVREDRKAARRAVERQLPLSAVGGRVARDLRAIASRLAEGLPERRRVDGRQSVSDAAARISAP